VERKRRIAAVKPSATSAAGNDTYDLQAIACSDLSSSELRGSDGFAIKLDDHAARTQLLLGKKPLERTWQFRLNLLPVGCHAPGAHGIITHARKNTFGLLIQRGIPIFPDRFVAETPDAIGDLTRRARVRNVKLFGCM
jgi:hypothetical protein